MHVGWGLGHGGRPARDQIFDVTMGRTHDSVLRMSGKQLPALWQGAVSKVLDLGHVQGRGVVLASHSLKSSRHWTAHSSRCFATQSGNDSGDKQDKSKDKSGQPKAGPGFFETFRKSFVEQFSRKTEEDTKVKEAMERLQQARSEAEEAARRSMDIAQKAAEEAKKQADKVEEQTRPTREKIGGGMKVVGDIAKKVVDNPLVRGTTEIGIKAAETILEVHEVIDKRSKDIEDKIAGSKVAQKVRSPAFRILSMRSIPYAGYPVFIF